MQTTLLRLLEHRQPFESEEHMKHWLLRVAVNESRKLLRSFWRRHAVPLDEWRDAPVFQDPAQSELFQAVMALDAKYRLTIYLYYYEGCSVSETAAALRAKPSTVQTWLQRPGPACAAHFLRKRKGRDLSMFDRRSYLDTISALRADPDKLEEIIKMKENDRRHIPHSLRPVAAVAAALALLGISVGAVNTEPVQEFLYHISTAVQVGVFRQDIITEEGVDLTIYHMPEVSLEDRDGRAILLLDGEETDITDALAQDGHYTFQQQSEGTVLDLTVTGSVQDWTLTCSVHGEGEEGPVYTYTGGGADSSTVTVDTGDEVSGVVSAEPKESGLTAASVTPAG